MNIFLVLNNRYSGLLDSTYRIFWPSYNDDTRSPGLTDDEFLEKTIQRVREVGEIPADAVAHIVDSDTLPPNREFINAWDVLDGRVVVNMAKARLLHMDSIRKVRNAELAKSDVPFMRAVEVGDTDAQARISTEKQALRDIPATFDITTDAGTPELLSAKWPPLLSVRTLDA